MGEKLVIPWHDHAVEAGSGFQNTDHLFDLWVWGEPQPTSGMRLWVRNAEGIVSQEGNSSSKSLHNPTGRELLYMPSAGAQYAEGVEYGSPSPGIVDQ